MPPPSRSVAAPQWTPAVITAAAWISFFTPSFAFSPSDPASAIRRPQPVGELRSSPLRYSSPVEESVQPFAEEQITRLDPLRRHPDERSLKKLLISLGTEEASAKIRPCSFGRGGDYRGLAVTSDVEADQEIFRVPLSSCLHVDLVDEKDTRYGGERWAGSRLAAEWLVKSAEVESANGAADASFGFWSDLLPTSDELREQLPIHWSDPSEPSEHKDKARGGRNGMVPSASANDKPEVVPPSYSVLSAAVDLNGRKAVERALEVYKTRKAAKMEYGLPDESAVREFLRRRFECSKKETERVVQEVVKTRGARRGGSLGGTDWLRNEGGVRLEKEVIKGREIRKWRAEAVREALGDRLECSDDEVEGALDLVQTRACRLELPSLEGQSLLVMAPVFDLLNHGDPHANNARFSLESTSSDDSELGALGSNLSLVVRADRHLSPGEEILIDYGTGSMPAWRCLINYGFVPTGNDAMSVDPRERAEVHLSDGTVYEVRSNMVPYEMVMRLAGRSNENELDAGPVQELTPAMAREVAFLAATAAWDLEEHGKKGNEIGFKGDAKICMKLLSDLRESKRRVLRTLEGKVRQHERDGWQYWRGADQEVLFWGGKEVVLFVIP